MCTIRRIITRSAALRIFGNGLITCEALKGLAGKALKGLAGLAIDYFTSSIFFDSLNDPARST